MKKRVLAATLLTTMCVGAKAEDTEAVRLKKLEQAVQALQHENTELKKAVDAKADVGSVQPSTAAEKLKIGAPVDSISLYGEVRLRYFTNIGEAAGLDAGDWGQRERLRYRFRLGADIKLQENWFVGILLETGNVARSANVTLGENPYFAKSTPPGLHKDGTVATNINYGDTVFLGRVFLKYSNDWLTVEGGKIPNPFVSSRMVWDPDLSPEGFAEQFKYTIGSPGKETTTGYSKDGKEIVSTSDTQGGMTFDLFANFGQFIYNDVGFENTFNSGTGPFSETPNGTDLWMLGWQIGARANFNKTTFLQIAPTLYNYTGGGNAATQGSFNGDNALVIQSSDAIPSLITFNQTAVNNLLVLDVPVEFDWKMWGTPFSIFGDFADNFDSGTRAARAGHPGRNEGLAYQIGASVGSTKKKGDFELRGWWQHSEAFALDQNLIDDDIFDGRLNMEGFYAQATYMITDSTSIILQGCHGTRIDDTLGTPGFGSLGTPAGFPLQSMTLFYADLNIKF
jgi:hypothetical protein